MSTSVRMPSMLLPQCPFEKYENENNALLLLGFSKNSEDVQVGDSSASGGSTGKVGTTGQIYHPSYQQKLNRMVNHVPSSSNYQSLNYSNISSFEGNVLMPMVARATIPDYTNMTMDNYEMQNHFQDDKFKSDPMDIKEDLANALITSSLVLHSVTHSKKRPFESDSNNTKHKRGVLLPPSSKVSKLEPNVDSCNHKSLKSNTIIKSDGVQNQSPAVTPKIRKSSAERYRQRNHRRKQFFGDKLVRVVELLEKYRGLVAEGKLPQSNIQQASVVASFPSSSTLLSRLDLPSDIDTEKSLKNTAICLAKQMLEIFFTDQYSTEQNNNEESPFVNTTFHVPSIRECMSKKSSFLQDSPQIICSNEDVCKGLIDLKVDAKMFNGTICRIISKYLEISNTENIDPKFKVKCLSDTLKITNNGKSMQMDYLWSTSRLCALGAVKEIEVRGQLDCTIITNMNRNICFDNVTIAFNLSSFIEQSANLKSILNISLKRNESLNIHDNKELVPL